MGSGIRALVGVLVVVAGSVHLAHPAAAIVTPEFECAFQEPGSSTWTVVWGYESTEGTPVDVPIGRDNRFRPGAENRGQPTHFTPGVHHSVVVVDGWNGRENLRWEIVGRRAAARKTPVCTDRPVPITGTGLSAVVAIVVLAGAGIALDQHLRRRRRLALARVEES
jgi:hypothetical protein